MLANSTKLWNVLTGRLGSMKVGVADSVAKEGVIKAGGVNTSHGAWGRRCKGVRGTCGCAWGEDDGAGSCHACVSDTPILLLAAGTSRCQRHVPAPTNLLAARESRLAACCSSLTSWVDGGKIEGAGHKQT